MVLSMKKNKMRKTLIFILIAAILLTWQGLPVLAETTGTEQSESGTGMLETKQPENQTGMSEPGQPENPIEMPEGGSGNLSEMPDGESESEPEIADPEEGTETLDGDPEEETETLEVQSENQAENIERQADTENQSADNELTDTILSKCIVRGQNPPGVIINLFDYSQDVVDEGNKKVREVAHDYYYWFNGEESAQRLATTYNSGISRGHLLRFGYTDKDCSDCKDYGVWNLYSTNTLCHGIVQNKLVNGFPVLNLSGKGYGQYTDLINSTEGYRTEESLAYLFSPYVANNYKAIYRNVQGLFLSGDKEGSYYYNSTQNFASYNSRTNSFILYNSPGVAKVKNGNADFCGQFFPFNTAKDVFDSYTVDDKENIQLTYSNIAEKWSGKDENDYAPVNGYIKCYAPNLNHYLGMTMEMRFLQPEGGCLPQNGENDADTPMTFKFSGDDDVWIFIDGVLVADLGGLHDACSLEIDFSDGSVYYVQEKKTTTLLEYFQDVYGNDSNPGGIEFRDNTFADNTVHTLKMFYLERGHMASNLNLDFNIQTLPIEPTEEEETDEEFEFYAEEENTDENEVATVESILPAVNNEMPDSIGIPKTGDDSLIGWWAALSIISLLGIGATVCNLVLTRKKHSSKK